MQLDGGKPPWAIIGGVAGGGSFVVIVLIFVFVFTCTLKMKIKSLSTASAEPYETPISVQATRFEMKDNAAYGHVNYIHKPESLYDTVN